MALAATATSTFEPLVALWKSSSLPASPMSSASDLTRYCEWSLTGHLGLRTDECLSTTGEMVGKEEVKRIVANRSSRRQRMPSCRVPPGATGARGPAALRILHLALLRLGSRLHTSRFKRVTPEVSDSVPPSACMAIYTQSTATCEFLTASIRFLRTNAA